MSGGTVNVGPTDPTAVDRAFANPTANVANNTGVQVAPPAEGSCPIWDLPCHAGRFLARLFLSLGGALLWFGGMLFDLSIEELVVRMGYWITAGGIGQAIDHTWSVVRDVVNLVFIFGFVYIGISTILGVGPGWRKLLAQLIIAALLVNFSLFFVKAIIDVANVAAIEVYQLINADHTSDIGTAFVSKVGLNGFFFPEVRGETLARLTEGGSEPTFYIMVFFFLTITGVVLAAAAIMIIVRFVALIFIMIGSPLYFAALGFPQLAKFTKALNISMVLQYAFYPAVFLFMMYVSLRILDTSMFSGNMQVMIDTFGGAGVPEDPKAFTILLQFFIAIALVITSLRVAKSFSMFGASAVVGGAEGILKRAGGGVTGFLGRNTMGRWGEAVAKRTDEDRKSSNIVRRGMASLSRVTGIEGVAQKGANAKYGSNKSRLDAVKDKETLEREIAANKKKAAINTSVERGGAELDRAVKGANTAQLIDLLKKYKPGSPKYREIVKSMTPRQFDTLLKSKEEDLESNAKDELEKARSTSGQEKPNNPTPQPSEVQNKNAVVVSASISSSSPQPLPSSAPQPAITSTVPRYARPLTDTPQYNDNQQ